jgi:hypothetical protein
MDEAVAATADRSENFRRVISSGMMSPPGMSGIEDLM